AFLCLMSGRFRPLFKVVLFGTIVFFLCQAALTFSRSGVYLALGSCAIAGLFLAKDAQARIRMAFIGVFLLVFGVLVILPALDALTGGALRERFENTNLSYRDELIRGDFKVWIANPVFGVGPGRSTDVRAQFAHHFVSHTELTRMVADHGLFGFISLVL